MILFFHTFLPAMFEVREIFSGSNWGMVIHMNDRLKLPRVIPIQDMPYSISGLSRGFLID